MGAVTLEGKVAVITGAGHGLGIYIARLFLAEGARIVATARRPEQLAEFEHRDDVQIVQGDVTVRSEAERMVDAAVERFGKLDILVNNAGIHDHFLTAHETPLDLWQRVMATNLTGPMLTCRRAIPIMLRAGRGTIVNVSSISGLTGTRGGAAYAASKHALVGLTEHIASAFGRSGIRCLAICPGEMKTGIDIGGKPSKLGWQATARVMGMRPRGADPQDVANVVLFAASDAASNLHAVSILTDGGWYLYQSAESEVAYE